MDLYELGTKLDDDEKRIIVMEWIASLDNSECVFYGMTKKEIMDYMDNKKRLRVN